MSGGEVAGAVWVFEFHQLATLFGRLEQVECGTDDLVLSFGVAGGAEGSTHQMASDDGAGHTHCFGDVAERPDIHGDRWYPSGFDFSCNVPDRHETDRSDGHKQHHIDLVANKLLRPLLRRTFHPPLSCRPGKRIQRVG